MKMESQIGCDDPANSVGLFCRGTIGFPNLSQRAVSAIYRIVIWNWQSRDVVIGSEALARKTSEQIPLASTGVSSNNGKIRAGTDVSVSHAGWNYDHIPGMQVDVLAVLAADSQGRSTAINRKRFMRCAVIMSKGIDAVLPRVGPIVLSQALFNDGRAIFRFGRERMSINQQRQVAVWENAVVLKTELLRHNEFLLSNGGMDLHM
jgi:hypothetical protein